MAAAWTETAGTTAFHARFDAVDVARQDRVEMAAFMARIKERPSDDPGSVAARVILLAALAGVVLVGKLVAFFAELRGIALGDGAFVGVVALLSLLLLLAAVLAVRAARGITLGQSLQALFRFVVPANAMPSYVDVFRLELDADALRVAGAQSGASTLRIPLEVVRGFGTSPAGIVVHGNDGRAYPLPCTLLDDTQHAPLARRLDVALSEIRAELRIAEADRGGYRGQEMLEEAARSTTSARKRP